MAKASEKQKENKRPEKKDSLKKGFFSGGWLTSEFIQRQRWYILFVFGIALFYISYRYYAEKTIFESQRLEAEVRALQVEYTMKSEELIRINKRSEILRQIQQKGLDLIESEEPPMRIKAD